MQKKMLTAIAVSIFYIKAISLLVDKLVLV